MTALEVLRGAREILVTRGWLQGWYGNPDGPCCVMGALRYSAGKGILFGGEQSTAELLHYEGAMLIGKPLTTWNDTPGRTQEDVLGLIDTLIQRHAVCEVG